MEEKKLTAEESLALIRRMIDCTRSRLEEQVGRDFMLMGYSTIAVALAVWLGLRQTLDPRWNYLWFIIPALYLIRGWQSGWFTKGKSPRNHLDRITGYIWQTIGLAGLMLTLTAFLQPIPILFIILVLMGVGTAITGLVANFRPFSWAGLFTTLLLAPATLWLEGIDRILLFAVAFAVLMVIPGHIANHRLNPRRQKEL